MGLQSRGANMKAVDGAGHTVFHVAAFYQPKVMKELVEISNGAYPENSWAFLKDELGRTPLDAASISKDPEMIELLRGLGLKPQEAPQPAVPAERTVILATEKSAV